MIVSPVSKTDILHRNQDRLITDTTAEKMVAQKQKRITESGDRSEITAATIRIESQLEQQEYDPEHGDESKQNHDQQTGPEQHNH